MIKTLADLDVFKLSYQLGMDIFKLTRSFPKEEKYSLIDQVVRSSRSIVANVAEGWGKRIYELEFKKHLIYSLGSIEETKTWILFAKDCNYIDSATYDSLLIKMNNLGGKIFKLYENWKS